MTKTLHRRLYEALPVPVYRRACKYISPTVIREVTAYELRTGSIMTAARFLPGAFSWADTKEGVEYWGKVIARMER